MRIYNDTQIFKEYRNGGCCISDDELGYIKVQIGGDAYKMYDDKANGVIAISLAKINQKYNEDWAFDLVDGLNKICESWGMNADWYVGDIDEEYVFVE